MSETNQKKKLQHTILASSRCIFDTLQTFLRLTIERKQNSYPTEDQLAHTHTLVHHRRINGNFIYSQNSTDAYRIFFTYTCLLRNESCEVSPMQIDHDASPATSACAVIHPFLELVCPGLLRPGLSLVSLSAGHRERGAPRLPPSRLHFRLLPGQWPLLDGRPYK